MIIRKRRPARNFAVALGILFGAVMTLGISGQEAPTSDFLPQVGMQIMTDKLDFSRLDLQSARVDLAGSGSMRVSSIMYDGEAFSALFDFAGGTDAKLQHLLDGNGRLVDDSVSWADELYVRFGDFDYETSGSNVFPISPRDRDYLNLLREEWIASAGSRLGAYDIMNVSGVPVLKDRDGTIHYFNVSALAHGCGNWLDPKPTANMQDFGNISRIGGVELYFTKPGFYEFDYHLEPWRGEFAQLEGGQVIVISGLDVNQPNELTLEPDRVLRHVKYPYEPYQDVIFNIAEPGSYTIGFGPYKGTLLPRTFLDEEEAPNSSSIRFSIKRYVDAKTTDETGFEVVRFVDLAFKEDAAGRYVIQPTVKDRHYTYEGPSADYRLALDAIFDLTDDRKAWVLADHERAAEAGYSPAYPFGKSLPFAVDSVNTVLESLKDDDFEWNDPVFKDVAAAKTALYAWTIDGHSEEKLHYLNSILVDRKYDELEIAVKSAAERVLPSQFPEYQGR